MASVTTGDVSGHSRRAEWPIPIGGRGASTLACLEGATLKVGVHVVNFDLHGGSNAIAPTLAEVGRAVEDARLDCLSVMDHYLQMEGMGLGDTSAPTLEAYTTLGFLAACTTTVGLHALVTGVTYRYPGLLAKEVTTVDVLSGGRAMLRIGAAW